MSPQLYACSALVILRVVLDSIVGGSFEMPLASGFMVHLVMQVGKCQNKTQHACRIDGLYNSSRRARTFKNAFERTGTRT